MLNRDFSSATARIAAAHKPTFEARQVPDYGAQFAQTIKDYQDKTNKDALIAALQGGDETAINKAYAAYDPQAAWRQRVNDIAEIRNFERQKELNSINNAAALDRARQIALLRNENTGTAAQNNVKMLMDMGYSRDDAVALAFAGQNASLPQVFPNLGGAGNKRMDQEIGKNYAVDLDEYNNMVSKLPELEDTTARLGNLAKDATYTMFGRVYDTAKKELKGESTKGSVARSEYSDIINNQVLPLMRDTFGAQFTEREGETLRATLGDVNKTPEEKAAALRAFITQKKNSIESKYRKLQSYQKGAVASAPMSDGWQKVGNLKIREIK